MNATKRRPNKTKLADGPKLAMQKENLLSLWQFLILKAIVFILGRAGLFTIIVTGLSVLILSHMGYNTQHLEYIWYVQLGLSAACSIFLFVISANLSIDLLSYYEFQLLPYTITGLLALNGLYALSVVFTLLSYRTYVIHARILELKSLDKI